MSPDHELPQFNTLYRPAPNSMGLLNSIARPDDDPEFLQYLKDSKPALDLALTALEKDYFLYPYAVVTPHRAFNIPTPVNPGHLFSAWFAYGNAQVHYWDEADQSIETFDNLFKVIKLHLEEHDDLNTRGDYWTRNKELYYKSLLHIIRNTSDTALIDNIETMLEAQPVLYDDMQRVLHNELRILDETLLAPETMLALGLEVNLRIEDRIQIIQLQNVTNFMRDQLPALEELVEKPVTEYEQWLKTSDWHKVPYTSYLDGYFTQSLMFTLHNAQKTNAMRTATLLAIPIERYKKDTGAYPNTLNALIPDYLDTIPLSPATNTPFQYDYDGNAQSYSLTDINIPRYGYDGNGSGVYRFDYITEKDFPYPDE